MKGEEEEIHQEELSIQLENASNDGLAQGSHLLLRRGVEDV